MSSDTAATPPSKRRVFVSRLFSTLLLWAIIWAAVQWEKNWLLIALTGFFGVAGAVEYYRLLRIDAQARSFNLLGLVICVAYWITMTWWVVRVKQTPPMWLELAALTASVHGAFLLCYRHQLEGTVTLQRIFSTVFGVVYTVIFFGFIARLMYFNGDGQSATGLFLVIYLVMVTKFSDMGAYAFGVVLGKHKMIPHISPAKSWEGLVGAFVTSFLAAVIMLWWKADSGELAPMTWLHGLLLAPVLCAAGITGDLAESVIKRCTAIKDSGHAFPGIGGILDLTDSLLFTAPVFYFYLEAISA